MTLISTIKPLTPFGCFCYNQGLLAHDALGGTIGLSASGQSEAEQLGPDILMRDRTLQTPSTVHVNASYSVVQIAGPHSSQTAQLSVDQSRIAQIVDQIERELTSLNMSETARGEAAGLVTSLRKAMSQLPAAGLRAISAALAGVLTAAGSELGKKLMDAIRIVAGK